MKIEDAKPVIDAAMPRMKAALGLNEWVIELDLDPDTDNWKSTTVGFCTQKPEYRKARVDLCIRRHKNTAEALETLRHELLHLLLGDELTEYASLVSELCQSSQQTMFNSMWDSAIERRVAAMESVLDNLGWTAEKMAAFAYPAHVYKFHEPPSAVPPSEVAPRN